MPETANFSYDGSVVLKLSGSHETKVAQPKIEIQEVENIIPVNVVCTVDGEPMKLTAYVDYTKMQVTLPSSTERVVVNVEKFKADLLEFFEEQHRQQLEAADAADRAYQAERRAETEAREHRMRKAQELAASVAAFHASHGSRVVTEDDGEED